MEEEPLRLQSDIRHMPRLSCGNFIAVRAAELAGLGVAMLPDHPYPPNCGRTHSSMSCPDDGARTASSTSSSPPAPGYRCLSAGGLIIWRKDSKTPRSSRIAGQAKTPGTPQSELPADRACGERAVTMLTGKCYFRLIKGSLRNRLAAKSTNARTLAEARRPSR